MMATTHKGLTGRCRLLGNTTYVGKIHVSLQQREITIEVVTIEDSAVGLSGDVAAVPGSRLCIEIADLQVATVTNSSVTTHRGLPTACELE